MRLKNKKILLSFLMLSTWCYGIDIKDVAEKLLNHLREDQNFNIKLSLNLTEPKVQQFLRKYDPTAIEKQEIIAKAKEIYSGQAASSTTTDSSDIVGDLLAQKYNLSSIDGEGKAHAFLQTFKKITSVKERRSIIKQAEARQPSAPKPGPTPTPQPGPNAEFKKIQEIERWGRDNHKKIIDQLKKDGIKDSESITFESIAQAARTLGIKPIPQRASSSQSPQDKQNEPKANAANLPKIPKGVPPPPPPPKAKNPITSSILGRLSGLPKTQPPTGKVPPPPPPTGKVPPPAPTPPPAPGKSNDFILDSEDEILFIQLIRNYFEIDKKVNGSTPPPGPKATGINPDLVNALELATMLPRS